MLNRRRVVLAAMAMVLLCPGAASAAKFAWEEVGELIKGAQTVTTLGPTLFGDEVSLQNGGLSFRVTDVSLRGNNALPVEITRTFRTKTGATFSKTIVGDTNRQDGAMGDWEIDLPHVAGVFARSTGWINPVAGKAAKRCSAAGPWEAVAPSVKQTSQSEILPGHEIWHGTRINLPGRGSMAMLVRAAQAPQPVAGGAYWITSDWTSVACLGSIRNGSGEGFLATTPDGTRYRFDWMAVAHEQYLARKRESSAIVDTVERGRFGLYATRVEDRFGNWVEYDYSNGVGDPVRLARIRSSDGREISLGHYSGTQGLVRTVTAGSRTWNYGYASGAAGQLTSVVLPDQSRWTINLAGFQGLRINYIQGQPGEHWRDCNNPGTNDEITREATITHPSGAVGSFVMKPARFRRDGIDPSTNCGLGNLSDPNDDTEFYPSVWDAHALVEKRVDGPGLVPARWTYTYREGFETAVVGPSDYTLYVFGNTFRHDEGKLLRVERGLAPDQILTREESGFQLLPAGQPWPATIGRSGQERGEDFGEENPRPLREATVTRQGVDFHRRVEQFDAWARPLQVTAWSSLGFSRAQSTTYLDDPTRWVLGQIKTQGVDGVEASRTEFTTNAQPMRLYAFGKLQQTLGYYGDGTLGTVTDGNNNSVSLSDWKRGLPQTVMFPPTADQPAATFRYAAVDADGWIRTTTDENGFTTSYDYDPMGRLSRIGYPVGGLVAWNDTTVSFTAATAARYGLPAGHWRQVVSTGNARKVTYFDGLWRPVVEEAFDAADEPATRSVVAKRYDAGGRATFHSYPQRSLAAFQDPGLTGTWTDYDALDRATTVRQHAESGELRSTTDYLAQFTTRSTNARGKVTATAYRAYDQPTFDEPAAIVHSEGAVTEIHRDAFGKTTALRRRNANASEDAWRHYVYDAVQRLCKTIEPESGATVIQYDAADNVVWSASGLSLPDTSNASCEASRNAALASGRRVDRSFDARNRLKTLAFPDGNGNQTWSYTPDGLPSSIVTANDSGGTSVINAYEYDRRRLLLGEAQGQPGWYAWGIGYAFDANGNLAGQQSPTGLYVDFAPNSLGQPTRAGTYATGVKYHPNGSIQQFTYGNGLVHSMSQNARQLPERSTDGGGALDHEYRYDAVGNVTFIGDHAQGPGFDRSMAYDGLDRLTAAGSQSFGGDGWHRFRYDALDNLKSWTLGGVKDHANYYYEPATNRLTNIQDSTGATIIGMAYDVQGNLANKNGQQFSFDHGNRLRTVLRDHVTTEAYRYDAHGRRLMAWRPGAGIVLSHYAQSGALVYQSDGSKGKSFDYIHLAGSLVATRSYSHANWADQAITFQHTDALGSPVATTSASGQVIDRTLYDPYGGAIGKPGYDGVGYTGHVMDGSTGLTYMQQRYYDAGVGRFLSVDPLSVDVRTGSSFNRYGYADMNPYKFADRDGREVSLVVDREVYTSDSSSPLGEGAITSTLSVTSDRSKAKFTGYALEDIRGGEKRNKDPLRPGTYAGYVRKDGDRGWRIELAPANGYANVQFHVGNDATDVQGCFVPGKTRSDNFVGNSRQALNEIRSIVNADGTGKIKVTIKGSSTPPPRAVDSAAAAAGPGGTTSTLRFDP